VAHPVDRLVDVEEVVVPEDPAAERGRQAPAQLRRLLQSRPRCKLRVTKSEPWAVRHLPLRRQPPAHQLHDRARPPPPHADALQAAARRECRPVRTLACCARAAGAGQSRACSHLGIFFSACSAVRGRTLQMCGRTLRSCASGPSTATARSPTATRTSSRRCSATTSCPRGALAGRHGLSYTPWCLDRLYRTHRHPKVRCLRPMRGLAHGPVHTELSARLEVAVPRTAL